MYFHANCLPINVKTLTKFKLEMYTFTDVKEIVNFICSKNMPLKCIKFGYVDYLTDEHVSQIVKLECCDDVKIKIVYLHKKCKCRVR